MTEVDVDLSYKINDILIERNMENVTVTPDYANNLVELRCPSSETSYDYLYDDLILPPDDIKIIFTVMGASREFEGIDVNTVFYTKIRLATSELKYDFKVTFTYNGN